MDSTSKEYWIDRFSKYNAPENIETHPPKNKEWYEDIKIPKDLAFNEISEPKELTPISAVIKSNFVFSPEAKMKIYAKARGIDPSRYSIQDNEIVFKGDDDKIYKEEASGVLPEIRKFALETATDPLTYFTGGAGYAARKIGAKASKVVMSEVASSIAAELLRQKVGEDVFDDKMSGEEKALSIGTTVGVGLGMEGIARGGKKLLSKSIEKIRGGNTEKVKKILSDTGV